MKKFNARKKGEERRNRKLKGRRTGEARYANAYEIDTVLSHFEL